MGQNSTLADGIALHVGDFDWVRNVGERWSIDSDVPLAVLESCLGHVRPHLHQEETKRTGLGTAVGQFGQTSNLLD